MPSSPCEVSRLFMPHTRGGWTRDLSFNGPDVLCIPRKQLSEEAWKQDYAIMDLFNDGLVHVPATKEIKQILFRIHHRSKDPSHQLCQVRDEPPTLVCLWELKAGEELTFDYNISYTWYESSDDSEEAEESSDPEDMEASFSLGTQVCEYIKCSCFFVLLLDLLPASIIAGIARIARVRFSGISGESQV